MCQATVYLNGEKLMEDVTSVRLVPDGIRLSTFFEAPKTVQAMIREIDLLKHRVWLEAILEQEVNGDES